MDNFASKQISNFRSFQDFVSKRSDQEWMYRGQSDDWPLKTTLERCLNAWEIALEAATEIESQTIRDFRRRYQGANEELINSDTLYCLAAMQHHGAPT